MRPLRQLRRLLGQPPHASLATEGRLRGQPHASLAAEGRLRWPAAHLLSAGWRWAALGRWNGTLSIFIYCGSLRSRRLLFYFMVPTSQRVSCLFYAGSAVFIYLGSFFQNLN